MPGQSIKNVSRAKIIKMRISGKPEQRAVEEKEEEEKVESARRRERETKKKDV